MQVWGWVDYECSKGMICMTMLIIIVGVGDKFICKFIYSMIRLDALNHI